MPKMTEEEWRAARERREQWEQERREKLRKVLSEASMPLSDEDIASLVGTPDRDFQYIIRGHPAHKMAHCRASYRTSLSVFRLCLHDLIAVIDDFAAEVAAEGGDIFDPAGRQRLQDIERRVQKEMFATTNAAASLVDHCRIVTRSARISGVRAKLDEVFGDDGLHKFVIRLRVLLHHIQFVEASWTIHYVFSEGTKVATFEITRETLLQAIAWSFDGGERRELEDFVSKQRGQVDVKVLLLEYGKHVDRFYEWFDTQINTVALEDYDRITAEKHKDRVRNTWNLLLEFALKMKVPVDPHAHLARYLTCKQINEINKLPRNSNEQVELIISMVDADHAINDALRKSAHQLFERRRQFRELYKPQGKRDD